MSTQSNKEQSLPLPQGVVSHAQAQKMAEAILKRTKADEAQVELITRQENYAEFARNELLVIDGTTVTGLTLHVSIDGKQAKNVTQDFSAQGLATLVDETEAMAEQRISTKPKGLLLPKPQKLENPPGMYSAETLRTTEPEVQAKLIHAMAQEASKAEVVATGSLKHKFNTHFVASSNGYGGFAQSSYCEVNVTARTSSRGSGWAWAGTEDAAKVDTLDATKRAIDLARRTEDAVAVEPGRYTVIIEPEALAQLLVEILLDKTFFISAYSAQNGNGVFSKATGGTRIGDQMADPRVQFLYDPRDPLMPFSPLSAEALMKRTHWLQDGVLKHLAFHAWYASENNVPIIPNPTVARLDIKGETQTLEQMIASTKRGIWVHRFSRPDLIDRPSLLLGAVTRDGAFLIENGKVTRPVRNMRFSESPFFLLSKIDAFGAPQRAHEAIVCPRLKVHDFEFTGLSDAI